MDHLDRVFKHDYVPTFDDFLRIREPSMGVRHIEISYSVPQVNRSVVVQFVDVGGQRSERKKWVGIFNNTTAIVWVVSLSEYDQYLYEDGKTRRFDESLNEFIKMVQRPNFDDCNFIVFLNKSGMFFLGCRYES